MKNRKLFIFHATDYDDFPLGGTIGTIKIFLKYTGFDCNLVGITNDKDTQLGQWQPVTINDQTYPFLPVAYSANDIVPHKLLLISGLTRYARKIRAMCNGGDLNAMIFVNRESYLPVRHIIGHGKKVHVIYKMTEAVNPLTTSGRRIAGIGLVQQVYYHVFIKSLLRGASIIFSINDQCRDFCQKTLRTCGEKEKIIDVNHYVDYERLLQIYQDVIYI